MMSAYLAGSAGGRGKKSREEKQAGRKSNKYKVRKKARTAAAARAGRGRNGGGTTATRINPTHLEVDGEVDHGDIQGGHPEGHACQLAVQVGQHLAHSLGGTGGGGDDVLGSACGGSKGGAREVDGWGWAG